MKNIKIVECQNCGNFYNLYDCCLVYTYKDDKWFIECPECEREETYRWFSIREYLQDVEDWDDYWTMKAWVKPEKYFQTTSLVLLFHDSDFNLLLKDGRLVKFKKRRRK